MIVGDISELEASHIYQTYSRKSLSFSKRFAEPAVILPSQWGEINLIEQKHQKKKKDQLKNHFDQTKNKTLWFKLSTFK